MATIITSPPEPSSCASTSSASARRTRVALLAEPDSNATRHSPMRRRSATNRSRSRPSTTSSSARRVNRLDDVLECPDAVCFGLFGTFERATESRDVQKMLVDPDVGSFVDRVTTLSDVFPPSVTLRALMKSSPDAPTPPWQMPTVAWPVHTLVLLACYYRTTRRVGMDKLKGLLSSGGLLSTGKGLLAALAVAMSDDEQSYLANAALMVRAAHAVGLVFQHRADAAQRDLGGCSNRSFALLVANIGVAVLQMLVECVNNAPPGGDARLPLSRVEVCRVISSRTAVVGGHPLDLERLAIVLMRFSKDTGSTVHHTFLPVLAPENSAYYNQGMQLELLRVWRSLSITIDAQHLRLPVFSPVDGAELQRSTNLSADVAGALTHLAQDLTLSLRYVLDGDVVLDFTAASMRVGSMMVWSRSHIVVLSQPSDEAVTALLPSPKPPQGTAGLLRTLMKCATINSILDGLTYERKPLRACVEKLSDSFVTLGLLIEVPRGHGENDDEAEQFSESLSDPSGDAEPTGGRRSSRRRLTEAHLSMSFEYGGNTFVAIPRSNGIVHVYNMSKSIAYYEQQHRCVLTVAAVEFARQLEMESGLEFPPHALLMCPSVFQLLELWDALDFVRARSAALAASPTQAAVGVAGGRQEEFRRALRMVRGGVASR